MIRLYVRDEDWQDHLGKRLRIIRGTDEITGTMKGRDHALSPMKSGEMAKAWLLSTDDGGQYGFVPSDGWDIYEEERGRQAAPGNRGHAGDSPGERIQERAGTSRDQGGTTEGWNDGTYHRSVVSTFRHLGTTGGAHERGEGRGH